MPQRNRSLSPTHPIRLIRGLVIILRLVPPRRRRGIELGGASRPAFLVGHRVDLMLLLGGGCI
jgi:hypothetical protein